MRIVVMGVSGCGKSTLGRALADALDSPFVEGDELHPPANVSKMRSGTPLDDKDRIPFLENVARALAEHPQGVVVCCSALKRSYRDFIRARVDSVTFVLPQVSREQLVQRLSQRCNHFMPMSLLDSQLATLETPAGDERAILIDGEINTSAQVAQALAALRSQSTAPNPEIAGDKPPRR